MHDRYSHVVLEVTVLICSVSPPCSANKSPCVSTQRILEQHCIPFPANQVFHAFNLLICVAVIHLLNSLTPGLVSMSSLWLVRYIPSSHIDCVPQCKMNGKFREHRVESLLGSPVPFSVH